MAPLLHNVAVAVAAGLNFVVTVLILIGAVLALFRLTVSAVGPNPAPDALVSTRQNLARWLSLALEFAVATDILLLAVTPTWSELGMLAAVVALRMALNYSLERELAAGAPASAASPLP